MVTHFCSFSPVPLKSSEKDGATLDNGVGVVVAVGGRMGPGEGVAVGMEVGQDSVGVASVDTGVGVSGNTVASPDRAAVVTGIPVAVQPVVTRTTHNSKR